MDGWINVLEEVRNKVRQVAQARMKARMRSLESCCYNQ